MTIFDQFCKVVSGAHDQGVILALFFTGNLENLSDFLSVVPMYSKIEHHVALSPILKMKIIS